MLHCTNFNWCITSFLVSAVDNLTYCVINRAFVSFLFIKEKNKCFFILSPNKITLEKVSQHCGRVKNNSNDYNQKLIVQCTCFSSYWTNSSTAWWNIKRQAVVIETEADWPSWLPQIGAQRPTNCASESSVLFTVRFCDYAHKSWARFRDEIIRRLNIFKVSIGFVNIDQTRRYTKSMGIGKLNWRTENKILT